MKIIREQHKKLYQSPLHTPNPNSSSSFIRELALKHQKRINSGTSSASWINLMPLLNNPRETDIALILSRGIKNSLDSGGRTEVSCTPSLEAVSLAKGIDTFADKIKSEPQRSPPVHSIFSFIFKGFGTTHQCNRQDDGMPCELRSLVPMY